MGDHNAEFLSGDEGCSGICSHNLTVTEKSIVVASVSEVNIPQGSTVRSANNDPFLGAANHIAIQNIVPLRNGHILVAIETSPHKTALRA